MTINGVIHCTGFNSWRHCYSDKDPNSKFSDFAQSQVDYLLGANPRGHDYVVGLSADSPKVL